MFFEDDSESGNFDHLTAMTARGFTGFLKGFNNIFLIRVLSSLLSFSDVLSVFSNPQMLISCTAAQK